MTLKPAALPLAALLALAAGVRAEEPVIETSQLDNGLELIVVEKHDVPLVTIEIAVKTGSFTETPATNGLSHLYEHMFFKGNAALPTQERYMARMSELGITFNGTTSTERVNYFITLPSRNFAAGMAFMADALLHPLFNQEELVSERKVVIGEYDRNEANPNHYLWDGLREHLYGDQAYRKNPLGERAVILSATREIMADFYKRFYVPNNSALLIVGDVNLTEARVLAQQLFGPTRWAEGDDPHQPPREPLPRLLQPNPFVVAQPTKVVTLAVSWPGPDVGRDERATFVADVWGTLCGMPQGRFQRAFRDARLTDSVNLYYYTQREGGEINCQAVVREGQLQAARERLFAEAAAMAEPGYWTEEELALAKRTLAIQRAYAAESGEDLSHNLSFWWASASYDYYTRYLEETGTVSQEELRAYVRNYIIGRPYVIGCLANEETLVKLGLAAPGEQGAPLALKPEALLGSGADGAPASASMVEELQVGNGVRAIFRREPGSAITALDVYLDGGCQTIGDDQQGVDALLLSTIMEGSKARSREQVQTELVALGARTSQDANYDYSRISLVAPREGFPRAAELLQECLQQPLLDAKVLEERRSQMKTRLEAEVANPDDYVVRLLNGAFFAGHPYARRPDGALATLANLTPDALRARLGQALVAPRVLLVLVGDMTGEEAKALLAARFGFIPAGKSWTRPALPAFQPRELAVRDVRQVPTTYVVGKCVAPAPGQADYPAARLALSLLRKRLWDTLRTKYALTYAPSAGISQFRGNYAYVYASTTDPQRAVALMHAEITRLQEAPVSAAELQGLIAQEETRGYARDETAASHANALGHAELVSGGWRRHYQLPRELAKVTPADVQRAARGLRGFTWALIGPGAVPDDVLRGTSQSQ